MRVRRGHEWPARKLVLLLCVRQTLRALHIGNNKINFTIYIRPPRRGKIICNNNIKRGRKPSTRCMICTHSRVRGGGGGVKRKREADRSSGHRAACSFYPTRDRRRRRRRPAGRHTIMCPHTHARTHARHKLPQNYIFILNNACTLLSAIQTVKYILYTQRILPFRNILYHCDNNCIVHR